MAGTVTPSGLYTEAHKCRACGNTKLIPILDLGHHALTGRFPRMDDPDPPVAPLELVMCDTTSAKDACGLIQIRHTCDLSQMYGPMYGYQSSITKTMVEHLHETASKVLALSKPQKGDWLLEVGSNDGAIQRFLSNKGFNLVAIDPSAAKFAASYPPESRLIVDFFSADAVKAKCEGNKFKAVISIAMFYDLEQPLAFMRDVRALLDKDGVWCCELAYLPSMFTALCYDTICHEHLGYYGLAQFVWLAKQAGLRLIDVAMNDINGGSFAVYASRDDSALPANDALINRMLASEGRLKLAEAETWAEFSRRVKLHRARLRTFFEDARAAGDLVLGLGASTKGNVILQYAGVTPELMPAIGERDLKKVGLRTPKTAIPIISEEDARRMRPRYFFVGPWHFRREIVSREAAFFNDGGRMVFPLPRFEIVRGSTSTSGDAADSPKIPWAKPMLFDDERVFIADALDSTMISGGPFVEEFEQKFAALHGLTEPAVTTSNGTTALHLAYLALDIKPGDEIIVPGWGFMAAANMALAIGAKPIFADIDPVHWMLDPQSVKAKITKKTKAVVAVHTYGNLCDLSELQSIAKGPGIALIEDCAESLGSQWSGKICGTFGDIATFSFQATKLLTSGEGGAIIFRSPEMAARARLIRNHAMAGRKRYWHHDIGHNFRLTNLQCAMLCAQLGHWPEIRASRAHLSAGYRLRLEGTPGVAFQKFPSQVEPVVWATGLQLIGASVETRDKVLDLMLEAGIECRPGFYPASEQPIYGIQPVGNSERIASQIIVPPIDATLTEPLLDYICETLVECLAKAGHK